MAIPIVLGGIALVSAVFGAKKGYDAHKKNNEAEAIVYAAQERFEETKEKLEEERDVLNTSLEEFASFKLQIFTTQINQLVQVIKKCKDSANSTFYSTNANFTNRPLAKLIFDPS